VFWFAGGVTAGFVHAQGEAVQGGRALAALPAIPTGQARIFFFRESHFVGLAATARLRLDGITVGWLDNGTAVFVDHPAGEVELSVDSAGQFGHDGFKMTLVAGQEYFVPVAAQASPMFTSGAAGYLLGNLNADVHQYCGGGWCAALIEKDAALPILSKLSVSGPNPNADHGLF